MLPIGLLAEELQKKFLGRRQDWLPYGETDTTGRTTSMIEWQQRWTLSSKGHWTYRLIPITETWVNRRHGEVNFYLTQLITGHGCFRAYLFKCRNDDSPTCPSCSDIPEDVEHVFFHCSRFHVQREALQTALGETPTPENLVQHMLESEDMWNAVSLCQGYMSRAEEIRTREKRKRRIRNEQYSGSKWKRSCVPRCTHANVQTGGHTYIHGLTTAESPRGRKPWIIRRRRHDVKSCPTKKCLSGGTVGESGQGWGGVLAT